MLLCKSSSPALTYCGHCDHEKIDTVPVCKTTHPVLLVIIGKIGRVAAIFKLQTKTKGMKRVCLSGWSMLMLTCLIYIIYIIATKKHTSKITWSTKCIAKTMHFLYHSYCYAVLSGCWLLLVLGQSLFVPQALQGGVGKGVWVWGKVDNFTKKKGK